MGLISTIQGLQTKIAPVSLLVVTKQRQKKEVEEVALSGITAIGENKLQEIEEKYDDRLFHLLVQQGVKLHFLGHVQRNKVKKIVRLCDVIQSVDSFQIAKKISEAAAELKKTMPIFLQLNLTNEPKKYGVKSEALNELVPKIRQLPGVQLLGFMTMGKEGNLKATRRVFRECNLLRLKYGVSEVSMGMSEDFEIALEEGATMVRLGSRIFSSCESSSS